jgi:CheY-like chemotaxis protein
MPPAPRQNESAKSQRRILVVEDHPDVARMVRLMVEMLGHRADVAGSLSETEAAIASTHFDLALVDYRLPDGTAKDVLRAIEKRERSDLTQAVLLTAYDENSIEPKLREGFSRCLRKPVDIEELRSVIADLCS